MLANFRLRLFLNMSNFAKLLSNQELINNSLTSLRSELADIEKLFKTCGKVDKSSNKLTEENINLEKQINLLKEELIRLETARGVKQVPIPSRDLITETPKEKEVNETPAPTAESVAEPQKKNQKQNKKEAKKKDENKKESKEEPANEGPIDVSRLDLRVGKIVEVKKHPDADSLYVEQIDIGGEQPITVVSGLVKHVPIEEMQGRMVVVLCNLKPAKMRGVLSEAMVMCASSPSGVEVLSPPTSAAPGDRVSVPGYPPAPDSVLNPKKKIFEQVAPDLKTDSDLQATYKGSPWTVEGKGVVTTKSLSNVNIK